MKERTNRKIILLGILLLIGGMSIIGQTNTVYIDPQYTGTKNGSIAQPYNSWADLTWKAGYTYLFKCGSVYNTSTSLRATANNIKIGSYGTGNRPKISSSVSGGKVFDFGSLSNVIVSDLEVESTNNAQTCFHFITGGPATLINCVIHGAEWGVRNIHSTGMFRIINCEIYMTGDDGCFNQFLDSLEVSGTYIHDVNQKWFVNQAETYSGGDVLQCSVVKYFNIHDNILDHSNTGNKFCFISENSDGPGTISTGVIENNTIKRSNNGSGIFLYEDQQNVLIKGNKFIGTSLGIYNHSLSAQIEYNEFINISDRVIEGLSLSSSNTKFVNNTIYNVNRVIAECYNDNITIQNNIIQNVTGQAFEGHSNLKLDYNCYYQMNTPGISSLGTNSINADPQFNNAANLDFSLKSGSPCIDKANNLLGSCIDLLGCTVPKGNAADIGALEFNSTGTPPSNKFPEVNITAPLNNSSYTAPASIAVTANALDSDGTVSKVEFYNGSIKLGESTTSPYSYVLNNPAVGTYSLTAIATDNTGNKTISSTISVTVNANKTPVVSITTPAANASFTDPATIAITAAASDDDGNISKVEFFNGSIKLGESTTAPFSCTWNNVAIGTYNLTAVATDNLNSKTTSIAVQVVVAPKVVSTGAIFYKNSGYSGTAVNLVPGNYTVTQLTALGLYDNTISSIVTNGFQVVAYADDNFTGTSLTFNADQPNLASVNFNDQISSIKVIKTGSNTNLPPVVSLTSPSNGKNYTIPANVIITAKASDADGTISKVEFYNGSTKLGESTTSPYSFTWQNVAYGTYKITAVATDNLGAKTTSSISTVYVNGSKAAQNPDLISGIANTVSNEVSINVYPNPSNGLFSVKLDNLQKNNEAIFIITDMTGKTIYNSGTIKVEATKDFDIARFRPGMYFLTVIFGDGNKLSRKIIKN
jgi:hypothetical protein